MSHEGTFNNLVPDPSPTSGLQDEHQEYDNEDYVCELRTINGRPRTVCRTCSLRDVHQDLVDSDDNTLIVDDGVGQADVAVPDDEPNEFRNVGGTKATNRMDGRWSDSSLVDLRWAYVSRETRRRQQNSRIDEEDEDEDPLSGFRYSSYQEFVDDYVRVQPEWKWLQAFLRKPGPTVSETNVTIIDCIADTLYEQGHFSNDSEEFKEVLDSRPVDVDVRLIVVAYQESWRIDKDVVDRLSLMFDIDPDFLRRHFYYFLMSKDDDSNGVRSKKDRGTDSEPPLEDTIHEIPHTFLSDGRSNAFHLAATRSFIKISAYVTQAPKTVLIFVRNQGAGEVVDIPRTQRASVYRRPNELSSCFSGGNDLASRYLATLCHFTTHEVSICRKEPLCFVHPFARDLVKVYKIQHQKEYDSDHEQTLIDRNQHIEDAGTSEDKLYQILFELGALGTFQREMERLSTQLKISEARLKFNQVRNDIRYLRQNFERSAEYFREAKGAALVAAQMTEAKASTDASYSVNRISKLAFIFIPLTFTTGVFGMNLKSFGSGTLSWRTFFLTAFITFLATCLPLIISIWTALRRSGFIDHIRIISRLSWISPTLAFWYIGLCMRFDHIVVMALCGQDVLDALKLQPIIRYQIISAVEAKRRMERSYYNFEHVVYWESKARLIQDKMDTLRPPDDVEK